MKAEAAEPEGKAANPPAEAKSAVPAKKADAKKKSQETAKEAPAASPSAAKSAEVVSLDSFRKK